MRTICTMLVLGLLTMAVPATSQADDAPDTMISIKVQNQEIAKVIEVIAKFGKANVIVAPDVTGRISIHLKDVDWKVALRVVTQAVGAEVLDKGEGVYLIERATEDVAVRAPQVKQPNRAAKDRDEIRARQELERLLVDSKKRADELRAKLEKQRGRFLVRGEEATELQAKVREAEKAAREAAEKRAKALAQPRVRLYTDLVMEDDGKGGQRLVAKLKAKTESVAQMVRIYDVGDLKTLNGKPIDIVKIIRGVMKGDGFLLAQPGKLVVRGSQEVHERVNRVLTKLRSAQQPNAVIGLGGGAGIKPWPRVKKKDGDRSFKGFVFGKKAAEAAKAQKKGGDRILEDKLVYFFDKSKKTAQPYVISLGASDGVVTRTANGDNIARRKAVAHLGATPFAAERKRIENLQRAAGYLRAAGDSAGAKRVGAQATAALQRLRQHEARAKSGTAHGEVRGSIDGLRREVHALRAEVRELTALVRRLLQQQGK